MTDAEKQQKEKVAAQALLNTVKELNESVPKMEERIKDLASSCDEFKGIDVKKVVKQIEELQSGIESIRRRISGNSNNPLFIPGLEDPSEQKKFSMIKAMLGVTQGGDQASFEKNGGGFEFEVMKEFRAKAEAEGQVVGVDSQGGFFVPDQVIPEVIQAIYTRSVFMALEGSGTTRVSVLDGLVGGTVKIPKFEGGVIAYWIGEQDEYAESKAKVGNVTMTPKKLGVLTRLTHEMRKSASYGFENLLRNDMIRAAAKEIDRVIPYGTGSENMPRGLTSMKDINFFSAKDKISRTLAAYRAVAAADQSGGELGFDGMDEMMGVLEDNNVDIDPSFAFISAPRFFRRLRQLKIDNYSGQTSNQPYLLGAPMIKDETLRGLIGEFDKTSQIPTTNVPGASVGASTDTVDAFYGDVFGANWNDVVFGRWSGIEIEDDAGKGKGFTSDEIYVKLRMYADVAHRQPKGIVVCPDAKMRDA